MMTMPERVGAVHAIAEEQFAHARPDQNPRSKNESLESSWTEASDLRCVGAVVWRGSDIPSDQ